MTSITALEGTGHSSSPDPAAAGREAVLAALGDHPGRAEDLVILFPKAAYDLEALHDAAAAAAAPAPVVGATPSSPSPAAPRCPTAARPWCCAAATTPASASATSTARMTTSAS